MQWTHAKLQAISSVASFLAQSDTMPTVYTVPSHSAIAEYLNTAMMFLTDWEIVHKHKVHKQLPSNIERLVPHSFGFMQGQVGIEVHSDHLTFPRKLSEPRDTAKTS